MPLFAPATLAHWTAGHWTVAPGRAFFGFSNDTRTLRPGEIFVALRTPSRDGHDYLDAAKTAGATAAIVSCANPAIDLPQLVVADPLAAFQKIAAAHRAACQAAGVVVIGISGSNGKTSTKNLLADILRAAHGADRALATEGNLNNHIGVPLTLTRIDPARHKYAVVEAGISAPGEMETLATIIAPDHAIITMIAPAHTEHLGNLETTAREKAVLLQHVRANGARIFPPACLKYPTFTALPSPAPISALQPFSLSAFPSSGMQQNTALAITLAKRLGVSDFQIQTALDAWRPSKWRGEIVRDSSGRLFYLDLYNANPASMSDALDAFVRVAPPELPRLYIIGGMEELGPESPRHHRELGEQLAALLRDRPGDELILIGAHAPDIAAGVSKPEHARIQTTDTAAAAQRIAAFQGAVFMKGSRRNALENTLPDNIKNAHL
ncbi:UDP-N-acetylmuramoyl-tripeptide--D-alanyl-D-alanine ligase [Ereboglobus sp. PH5-10]|uniref:UDP-N-acetylmuramoyl-tripeptide--D-alanyl-D- alanine ligase n=1 Tax=Ereboglobus sp. PH5-10 TaxID=2940629 RepID=UPI002405DD9B|nr:UDP-N-acetylmuramoyl-tripeptide--D-alanyl-D-alanine ligase [Ereboglobus sp. PH5-10]MDF9826001.1 UDP-N-acetylmuramoyl-tripeptide--D-alanyl-D-alanine ligase [Ereboglobus sp. PH5-10]